MIKLYERLYGQVSYLKLVLRAFPLKKGNALGTRLGLPHLSRVPHLHANRP